MHAIRGSPQRIGGKEITTTWATTQKLKSRRKLRPKGRKSTLSASSKVGNFSVFFAMGSEIVVGKRRGVIGQIYRVGQKLTPFQLRQYNVIYTAKQQIFVLFEQF